MTSASIAVVQSEQTGDARSPITTGRAESTSSELKDAATDEEILGLGVRTRTRKRLTADEQLEPGLGENAMASRSNDPVDGQPTEPMNADGTTGGEPDQFLEIFDANPELRTVWHESRAYKESFATPEEAKLATVQLADLRAMDSLFFSKEAKNHVELARFVAKLDPMAFSLLADAMSRIAKEGPSGRQTPQETRSEVASGSSPEINARQQDFLQMTNAAAVKGVLEAIESQIDRLLPESISQTARQRITGEVYRELDTTLQTNGQLGQQLRGAFRSGAFDTRHREAIASLIIGRAKQALPSVAKRVLGEWTSTVVTAHDERRARQRAAESRVDITGSRGGNDGHRVKSPRDIDYTRMSDAEILNL